MTLRAVTVSDIPMVRAIAHATWPVCYAGIITPAQIAYMLDLMYSEAALHGQLTHGHEFLSAENNGTAIGFAGFEHRYSPPRRVQGQAARCYRPFWMPHAVLVTTPSN